MPFLLLIFIVIPLVEIYFLIQVGGMIGAVPTVALVVLTAFIGVILLRIQGFATLRRVQLQLSQGQLPALELMEGVVLVVAGALLLTPGFFTDTIGFLCLVPGLRRSAIKMLFRESMVNLWVRQGRGPQPRQSQKGQPKSGHQPHRTIEGEYHRDDD